VLLDVVDPSFDVVERLFVCNIVKKKDALKITENIATKTS
jgi:hypothetical protein